MQVFGCVEVPHFSVLRHRSGTFKNTRHKVDEQDDSGAVRQVPGLVVSRIVKNNALADLPASCFAPDSRGAITLGNLQRQMAAQQAATRAAMGLNATVRLRKAKSGGRMAW